MFDCLPVCMIYHSLDEELAVLFGQFSTGVLLQIPEVLREKEREKERQRDR